MIIAQISDSHIDPDDPDAEPRIGDLERVVAHINGLDTQPDAVIHTGDLTHNGTHAKYAAAAAVLKDLAPPLHIAAGNRDDRALLDEYYPGGRDLMPGTPYRQFSVDDYPIRLIALDTLSQESNMGDFCQDRADSLKAALAEQPDTPTVLFMHHPPFVVTASRYTHQYDDWDGVGRMAGALEGHAQVIRAFTGHAHRDAVGAVAHVPASSAPSLAIDLRLGAFGDGVATAPLYKLHRFGNGGVETTLQAAQ
ncbi:MAG: metallophosphoesterase [Magnetovibrio sp.]|nr:metallophosphoesterase [Magnetovibrio sp.]